MVREMSNPPKKPSTSPDASSTGLKPAGWGRRFGALFIDWIASSLALIAVAGPERYSGPNGTALILPIMLGEIVVFTALVGGSFGQIVVKMRVRHLDGSRLNPWEALIRTILIGLIIPPLIYKPDGRGLHDLVVNSAVYRYAT